MVQNKLKKDIYGEEETFPVQIDGPDTPLRPVRVLDLLDPSEPRADKEKRRERMSTCRKCPELQHERCNQCGCVMLFKTWLDNSTCPLNKW